MSEERTELAVCIGTFDKSGLPIAISKALSHYATVTFQAISLNMLVSRSLELGCMQASYVKRKDGLVIRIERNPKGFIAYLETPEQPVVLTTENVNKQRA